MLASNRLGSHPQLQNAAQNSPPLKKGSTGQGVAELQDLLVDLGARMPKSYAGRKPDGIFGSETDGAVRDFQKKHGLAVDGVAGRMTLGKLDEIVLATSDLEVPHVAEVAAGDLADRGKPVWRRKRAEW